MLTEKTLAVQPAQRVKRESAGQYATHLSAEKTINFNRLQTIPRNNPEPPRTSATQTSACVCVLECAVTAAVHGQLLLQLIFKFINKINNGLPRRQESNEAQAKVNTSCRSVGAAEVMLGERVRSQRVCRRYLNI